MTKSRKNTRMRNYAAEYRRRKARARSEGFGGFWQKRAAAAQAATPAYEHLTRRQQDVWHRAYRAARSMADKGWSLAHAARRQGTTPGTVLKYGQTFIERRGRRWQPATKFLENQGLVNRLERFNIITADGITQTGISDARMLSQYARYANAVKGALRGNRQGLDQLSKFRGKFFIDSAGKRQPYVTDVRLLARLYDDGLIAMDTLYAEPTR